MDKRTGVGLDDSFFGFLNDQPFSSGSQTNSLSAFSNKLTEMEVSPKSGMKGFCCASKSKVEAPIHQIKLRVRLVELSEDCSFPRSLESSSKKPTEVCIMEKEIGVGCEGNNINNNNFAVNPKSVDDMKQRTHEKKKKYKNKRKNAKNKDKIPANSISPAREVQNKDKLTQTHFQQFNCKPLHEMSKYNYANTHFPFQYMLPVYSQQNQICNYVYNNHMYQVQSNSHPYAYFNPAFNNIFPANVPGYPRNGYNNFQDDFSLDGPKATLECNYSGHSRIDFWKSK